MPVTATTEVATRTVEAFNDADWGAFRASIADDVVYIEAGTGRRVEGADAYLELCRGWKEAFPDVRGTIRRSVEGDGWSALAVTWQGTHQGTLATPNGDVPASGRQATVEATLWSRVQDGVMVEAHHHLDVLALLAQIGALPS